MKSLNFKLILIVILSFVIYDSFAQEKTDDEILDLIDNYPEFKDIEKLSNRINSDFNDPREKAFAIYAWIAKNINYVNPRIFIHGKKGRRQRTLDILRKEIDCVPLNKKEKIYLNKLHNKTIKKNNLLDLGNAILFSKISELCGIESKIILGSSKVVSAAGFRTRFFNNYAWNSIFIDNQWHVVDVTYGSMSYGFNKATCNKLFSKTYFMTNPIYFHQNHYTTDPQWAQYQDGNKEKFRLKYLPHTHLIESEIKVISPQFSEIKISSSNLVITLDNVKEDQEFTYYFDYYWATSYVNPIFIKDSTASLLLYDFILQEGYMTIYCDGKPILTYYLNPIENPDLLLDE